MKCPRCQTESYEGARFCTGCGCLLHRESPVKKFFMAGLHAFLYVALFIAVSLFVSVGYEFIMACGITWPRLLGGGTFTEEELSAIAEEIGSLIIAHQHMLMILSGLITILILVLSFRIRHKDPVKEMHVHKIPLGRAPWYVVLGISLQPVTGFFLSFLPQAWLENFAETNTLNYSTEPLAIELLSAVILAPIVEELTFRGLAFTRLRRGMGTVLAVLITSALFGAVHGHPVSFIYASVLGIVLALLMLKSNDSVLAPILCHAGFNGGNYLLNLLLENTQSMPLILAAYVAALALLILSAFMVFRPITEIEEE